MKVRKIIAGVGVLFCVVAMVAFVRVEDDPIKKIVTQLTKWTETNPQEKAYLHTDKPYYAAGESIWFKAYVTIGEKHQLSALSKIVYVDLIDYRDSIKQTLKLPLNAGVAFGDFALSDTLKAGNYRLRAYTNYMRNAGDDYFFDKTFYVGNATINNIFTNTAYVYSNQGGQQKVTANISYKDLNGTPYANKEVSYEVQADAKNITRGKGLTDANGILSLTFNNSATLKANRIVTNIKYADKKTDTQTLPIKAVSDKVDVQFFPEGGNMVNGIRSKVGFKATGADGLGVDIKGVIKDNTNTDVAKLGDTHFGMGFAMITPEAGKTYKAALTMPDGSVQTVALPAAMDKGYTLGVFTVDTANVLIKIGVSQSIAEAGTDQVSIVAQQNGHVYYAANTKINKTSIASNIPKNRFPSGIVQFTLFSATGEPICERVAFIQNNDLLKLSVNTDKQSYSTRQPVKLNLNAKDASGKPVLGSFSVSVTDESKVAVDESAETTILSSMLLTSDLKGYIEKPNYYFTNPSEQTRAELDALMLTQGYRRFVWKQILSDVFPVAQFQPERYLNISGAIKTSGGKPVPRAKVMLFTSVNGRPLILDTVADANGRFMLKDLVFKDSIRFVVQGRTEKGGKNVEIEMDNLKLPSAGKNKNTPDLIVSQSSAISAYLQNSKNKYLQEIKYGVGDHVTVLREVVISEKKKTLENSSNLNGAGNADQVIKGDQLSTCASLDLCLNGLLRFITIRGGQAYSTRSPNTPMRIVLDGMDMGDDFTLDNIVPSDVESIEVLRTIATTAIYGGRAGGGLILITTKRGGGSYNTVRYAPGIVTFAPKGYNAWREFYAPKYDDPKTNAAIPDLRSTVFWKPDIITDASGNASLNFFNADGRGTYRVVVEGIDGDGNLGRQVFKYKVN